MLTQARRARKVGLGGAGLTCHAPLRHFATNRHDCCGLSSKSNHLIERIWCESAVARSNAHAITHELVVSMTSLMVPSAIPISHFPFSCSTCSGDDRSLHIHCLEIMDFFSFEQLRWIRQAFLICLLTTLSGFLLPLTLRAESGGSPSGRVSLDFNDVELSVFVRFISELTGKNFVLDEVVKKAGGKISVYSPTKVTQDQAYSMFVAALEVSRLAVVLRGQCPSNRGDGGTASGTGRIRLQIETRQCDRPCGHPDQSRRPISDRCTDDAGYTATI